MNTNTCTILLVEDSPDDVLMFQRAAVKAALPNPVQVVGDGEAAMAYLAGRPPYADRRRHPLPCVVLLDLKLPRKSGLEVLEWLRGQPALRRLPVVILTTSREASDINRAYDGGANSYLVKPFSFERLLEMVRCLHTYWIGLNESAELLPR